MCIVASACVYRRQNKHRGRNLNGLEAFEEHFSGEEISDTSSNHSSRTGSSEDPNSLLHEHNSNSAILAFQEEIERVRDAENDGLSFTQ